MSDYAPFLLRVATYGLYFAACLVCLIALYAFFIIRERRKFRHIPGPPHKNFFAGNIHVITDYREEGRDKVFVQLGRDYGPLVKLTALHQVVLFATTPEIAKELLTNSRYKKPKDMYDNLVTVLGVPYLGHSIATIIDYKEWKVRRHALNPTFHRTFLTQLIPAFNTAADTMIEMFEVKAQSQETVSMLEEMGRATLDAICQIAFSFDIHEVERKGPRSMIKDLQSCADAFTEFNYYPAMALDPTYRHKVRKYREALRAVRKSMQDLLDRRLEQMSEGVETPRDILAIMLEGLLPHCCKEDIVSEMVTILEAGQETTAAALSSLMLELGRHPKYQEKIREEVMSVIGDRTTIEAEDLDQLHWITAVLKESLRVHPPAQGTSRELPEDTVIGGFKVPKGTTVLINFTAIHHLHHEDGGRFKPEKWLPENEPRTNFNFLPFSLGQRACIGRQFSWMESKILLSKFFQRYSFQLDPKENFYMKESLTLRPSSGALGQVLFAKP